MKRKISFMMALVFVMSMMSPVTSAKSNEPPTEELKNPDKAALWSVFIPGGGHFYLGEYKTGFAYLLGEVGLYLAGRGIEERLEEGKQNVFYIHALKLHELGIFTAYRNARLKYNNDSYTVPIDDTPISTLILAPFRWRNIKTPEVVGAIVAGILLNLIEFQFMDEEHDSGLAFCGVSPLVALSEECLWRGVVQTQFEEGLGKEKGLIVSSLLFGIGHITEPTEIESWINGAVASLYGFYLGRLYQEDNYRLERAIAAHFWFNVGAGITLFLLDPENNPLGLKITFAF